MHDSLVCLRCNDTGIVVERSVIDGELYEAETWCHCNEGIKRHVVRNARDFAFAIEQQQTEMLLEYPMERSIRYGLCMGDEHYRVLRRCVINRWEPEAA